MNLKSCKKLIWIPSIFLGIFIASLFSQGNVLAKVSIEDESVNFEFCNLGFWTAKEVSFNYTIRFELYFYRNDSKFHYLNDSFVSINNLKGFEKTSYVINISDSFRIFDTESITAYYSTRYKLNDNRFHLQFDDAKFVINNYKIQKNFQSNFVRFFIDQPIFFILLQILIIIIPFLLIVSFLKL